MQVIIQCFLLIALVLPLSAFAIQSTTVASNNLKKTDAVVLNDEVHRQALGYEVDYLEDSLATLTIEDLQNTPSDQFKSGDLNVLNFGITTSAYWVKITVVNPFPMVKNRLLEIPYPHLDKIDLYLSQTSSDIIYHQAAGDLIPYSVRDVAYRNVVFSLPFGPSSENTLYLRFESEGSLQLPLILWSSTGFIEKVNKEVLGLGLYYGIMLVLILYNGFIYLSIKDKSYLYYISYLSFFTLFNFWLNGLAFEYLWPNYPVFSMYAGPGSFVLSMFLLMLFLDEFLLIRKDLPFAIPLSIGVGLCTLALLVVGLFFEYRFIIYAMLFIGVLMATIAFSVVIVSLRKGILAARFILLAFCAICLGGILYAFKTTGLLPSVFITEYSLQIGSALEGILLSLALGDRINQLKTREIQAQKSSIRNLERYEETYKNSYQGLFHYTFHPQSLRCNDALARLFGFKDADDIPIDSNPLTYFSELAQQEIPENLKSHGHVKDYVVLIVNPHVDKEVWVSMSMRLVKDEEGDAIGTEGSLIDVSERILKEQAEEEKRGEEMLRYEAEKNHEISEEKNKAKTQFFASMSHEFRTPLTAILGYTALAERADVNDQDRMSYVNTIRSSAQHMLQLINDVLDLSKIEAQKLDVELIPVSTVPLIQEVHDFIWILANQQHISFDIDYQFPLPSSFITDSTRLKQALINLCSNSVKFTNKGGVTLHVSCDSDNQEIIFAIEDTGIGLKPEQLDSLFEAFTQADKSTSRNFGGTGLGLYLSQLMAKKLGGEISVVSEFNKGSTFTIKVATGSLEGVKWIEKIEEAKRTYKPMRSDDSIRELKKNKVARQGDLIPVMLVEDNKVNQKLLGFHLKQAGVEVVIANDGLEAISHGLRREFELILMDMDMPNMDGLTATRYLRMKEVKSKIYALTGNTDAKSVDECLDAGCDGHLEKPFDLEKLNSVIESLRTPTR